MDDLDDVFRALADPTRRRLLDRLDSRAGQTLVELCEGLAMTRQAASKHLAVLEAARLVVVERRGREKHHYLNAAPVLAVADRWIRPFDRRRATALADLTTALETPMTTDTETETGTEFTYSTYIRTTPERLWDALTRPEFTEQYWGVRLESDWQAGSPVVWTYAGVRIEHPEQLVRTADRPRELSITWHTITPEFGAAIGAPADLVERMAAERRSHVTFRIEPAGDGVVELTVHHAALEPGGEIAAGVQGGWPQIAASLKSLLETGEPLALAEG